MQVDWKSVCQCAGYKSLKAAYIRDAAEARAHKKQGRYVMRKPDELYRAFQKALALVYRCAVAAGMPFEHALALTEADRSYWWLNYYQRHIVYRALQFSPVSAVKPQGLRGIRKYLKQQQHYTPAQRKERLRQLTKYLKKPEG